MKKKMKLTYVTKKEGKKVMEHIVLIDEKDLDEFNNMLEHSNNIRKQIKVEMEVLNDE